MNTKPATPRDGVDPIDLLRLALADAYAHGERDAPFALEGCVEKVAYAFASRPQPADVGVGIDVTADGVTVFVDAKNNDFREQLTDAGREAIAADGADNG